jgi:hypothetical protein
LQSPTALLLRFIVLTLLGTRVHVLVAGVLTYCILLGLLYCILLGLQTSNNPLRANLCLKGLASKFFDLVGASCRGSVHCTQHQPVMGGTVALYNTIITALAGVTIVIVREDLLGSARTICPTMLDYKITAENESMYNTPPCWAIYVCGLVFKNLLREGGLEKMQLRNREKVCVYVDCQPAEMTDCAHRWTCKNPCIGIKLQAAAQVHVRLAA